MKKDTKVVILLYLGVFLFTCFLSLSQVKLESREDVNRSNQRLVLNAN